nr:hypothetical protein [Physocyclus mexicanus]
MNFRKCCKRKVLAIDSLEMKKSRVNRKERDATLANDMSTEQENGKHQITPLKVKSKLSKMRNDRGNMYLFLIVT